MITREQIERWRMAGKVLHIEDWHAVLNLAAQALDQGADAKLGAAVRAAIPGASSEDYAMWARNGGGDLHRAIARVLREEEAP